ncbi:MAG: hypothetical protein F6K56_23520 [Moorea sp. SIO3G5]|nr:hypothetical protein [Moorena sp. SIO3G5]
MAKRPRYANNLSYTERQGRTTFNFKPSTFNLQPFNPSTLQPFNPSTLQPF